MESILKVGPNTPYLVMVGDVGTGKSTIVEKITDEIGRSSDNSLSFTKSSEPFWTYDGSMVICDTPGSNAMDDKLVHNIWIAHALNYFPVWRILIVVKADTRIDNVVGGVRKYAEMLLDLPGELIAVLVTHMDQVDWKPDDFEIYLWKELGIKYTAFSDTQKSREELMKELKKICSRGNGVKITINDENFFKLFKINDNRLKIMRSTKREVDAFKKEKADFDEVRTAFNNHDQVDLIFQFQEFMKLEIENAQKRVAEENGFTFYGPEAANEAGHIANMVNQMRLVLYDIRVEASKHQSSHGVGQARQCPYCKLVWTKVEGCTGATTCGNKPSTAFDARDPSYGVLGTFTFRFSEGLLKIFKSGQRSIEPLISENTVGCGRSITWSELQIVDLPPDAKEAIEVTMDDNVDVLSTALPGASSFKDKIKQMLGGRIEREDDTKEEAISKVQGSEAVEISKGWSWFCLGICFGFFGIFFGFFGIPFVFY